MSLPVTLQRLHGAEIKAFVGPLARLRMTVFREWPYLYEGSEGYERAYLQTYLDSPDSVALLCWAGEALIGASTALPLATAEPEMRMPFQAAGDDLDRILYFGESLILAPYRGRGLGGTFFAQREAHARELGLNRCCFCAVQRPAVHPRKPPDYRGNDAFWRRQGYHPTEIVCRFSWPDTGETSATTKPMRFWMKELDRQ